MVIKKFHLDKDVVVFCLKASSFPQGILQAHEKLHALILYKKERRYFGISRPNRDGVIEYSAAAEEMKAGEAEQLVLEKIILKAGEYICIDIPDFVKDAESISRAFAKLLAESNLDPNGYCVEWYYGSKDVKCMIRLNS